MKWRVRDLVEESVRRTTLRHAMPGLLVFALAAALTFQAGQELFRAEDAARNQLEQGVSVFSIEPQDSAQPLNAQQCELLNGSAIVESAGAVYLTEPARWMPANLQISAIDLSLGALRAWWPQAPPSNGIYLGQDLSDSMSIFPGAQLRYSTGTAPITAMAPDSVKDGQLRASAIRVVGPQPFATQCLVRTLPGYQDKIFEVVQTAFLDEQPKVTPHARLDDLSASPHDILLTGGSRWLWIAGIGAFLLATALRGLMSRSETGIYRSLGTKRLELFVMASVQAALLVLPAGLVGTVLGTSLAWWFTGVTHGPAALWFVIFPGLLLTLGTWLLGPFTEQVVTTGAIVDQLKE